LGWTESRWVSLMRDLGVSEGDIPATNGHSITVVRAVYSHPTPKERRSGTDAIATALEISRQKQTVVCWIRSL
jgi:hypothetical protein